MVAPEHSPDHPLDRRYVTIALMVVMVLASMEQTITSTAMPTIITQLHGLEHYAWVTSIYLLACTISMPLYGRLADTLGRKRVILGAISLFLVGSLLASTAHSMLALVIYRGLQGLGAGGIMPVVLTILGDLFTLEERAGIQAFFSIVWGTSALAGPALGAVLVRVFGWPSIFLVNVPLGALALGVLIWKYHETPHENAAKQELDALGLASLALACSALLVLVSGLAANPWFIAGLLALALVSGFFFIRHEKQAANPILPPGLMSHPSVGPSMLGSCLLGVSFLAIDTYVPLYVQGARGGSIQQAAGVVTPIMLTWALSGIPAARLMVRWGFRRTATLGAVLVLAGILGVALTAWFHWPSWLLTGFLALTGTGMGPTSMSYLLGAQEAVGWQQRGVVTSGVTFFRTLGGSLGIGLLGTLLNRLIQGDLKSLERQGISASDLLDPTRYGHFRPEQVRECQAALGSGLLWVFLAMVAVALLQLKVCRSIAPGAAHAANAAAAELELV